MKTGFGLYRKLRLIYANLNLFRFWWRKNLIGFDVANVFLQRVDKRSIQLILRKNGATIGKNCDIETGLIFHNCNNYKNLIIGNDCHIGKNCFFDLRGKVNIEDNVVISMQCSFITHQDMNKSALRELYPASFSNIVIKNNSYLGANATILQGVTVGRSSIVAAGALVKKNTRDFVIIAGVPAKTIKNTYKH